jgi:hypothetical protein
MHGAGSLTGMPVIPVGIDHLWKARMDNEAPKMKVSSFRALRKGPKNG